MDVKSAFLLFAAFGILFAGCAGGKGEQPANSGQGQTDAQNQPSPPGSGEQQGQLTPPPQPSGDEQPPALPPDEGQWAAGSGQQGAGIPPAPEAGQGIPETQGANVQAGENASSTPADEFAGKYTFWDINAHDTNDACWVYAGTSVYDVTGYITKHPGGMYEIFSACASNVTKRFENSTGPGNVPLLQYLEANYKVGELVPGDKKLHPDQ